MVAPFKRVKAAALDFMKEAISSDLALHIAHGPADNAAVTRCFGGEEMIDPRVTKRICGSMFHAPQLIAYP